MERDKQMKRCFEISEHEYFKDPSKFDKSCKMHGLVPALVPTVGLMRVRLPNANNLIDHYQ